MSSKVELVTKMEANDLAFTGALVATEHLGGREGGEISIYCPFLKNKKPAFLWD